MKPEQQRIAITEACGWKPANAEQIKELAGTAAWLLSNRPWWRNAQEGIVSPFDDLPDYLNDLNAMHEAEKMLKWKQRKQYHSTLVDVAGFSYCEADTQEETELDWNCRLCHATAAQRAEAFLRTLNLWID